MDYVTVRASEAGGIFCPDTMSAVNSLNAVTLGTARALKMF